MVHGQGRAAGGTGFAFPACPSGLDQAIPLLPRARIAVVVSWNGGSVASCRLIVGWRLLRRDTWSFRTSGFLGLALDGIPGGHYEREHPADSSSHGFGHFCALFCLVTAVLSTRRQGPPFAAFRLQSGAWSSPAQCLGQAWLPFEAKRYGSGLAACVVRVHLSSRTAPGNQAAGRRIRHGGAEERST